MAVSLFLVVALGGLIGAPSRYLLDRAITTRIESDLPWGTFTINITGSLLLGFLTGLSINGNLPLIDKDLLGTGFCGAYTTFSTFTYETVRLLEDGRILDAVANVAASVAAGLAAAAAGIAVGLAI
jgi:fluoride exporter